MRGKLITFTFIATILFFSIPELGYAQDEKTTESLTVESSFFGGMSYYYDGEEISENKFTSYIFKFDDSTMEWEKSKTMRSISVVCGAAAGVLIGWPIGESIGGADEPKWYLAGIGAAILIPAIILDSKANGHVEKAAEAYNNIYSRINASIPESLDVGFSNRGVQFSYSF